MRDILDRLTRGLFTADGLSLVTRLLGGAQAAPHPRQRIRHAVRGILVDSGMAPGQVFGARIDPLWKGDLPAVSVYTHEDLVVDGADTAPRILVHELELRIEVVVSTPDEAANSPEIADLLDTLCYVVEIALQADETLGGVASDTVLDRTDTEFSPEGERLHGRALLSFKIRYDAPALLADLDDFEGADVDWDLGPPDGQIEAEDVIEFPTQS